MKTTLLQSFGESEQSCTEFRNNVLMKYIVFLGVHISRYILIYILIDLKTVNRYRVTVIIMISCGFINHAKIICSS